MKAVNLVMAGTVAALLVGCSTPSDIVKVGHEVQFQSALAPLKAAACIAQNADESPGGSLNGSVRKIDEDPVEVVVRAGSNAYVTGQVFKNGTGSTIKLYLGGLAAVAPEYNGKRFTKGCI
jgi:hypothetical protein